jgi:hypothetical protein
VSEEKSSGIFCMPLVTSSKKDKTKEVLERIAGFHLPYRAKITA